MSGALPQPPFAKPVSKDAEVAAWIDKAWGDVGVAIREHALGSNGSRDAVCYHAQQAVEKLLKATLLNRGVKFPKTHDLIVLSALLSNNDHRWSWDQGELSTLTSYAVEYRYPSLAASQNEANTAVQLLSRIWAALAPLVS